MGAVHLTTDRESRESIKERINYARARFAEHRYASQLRKIARHIGEIVNGAETLDPGSIRSVNEALRAYARAIQPWARATARGMLVDVMRRDEKVWAQIAGTMAGALRRELRTAPTGVLFEKLMEEQVGLITSLPLEAGQRIHRLTTEGLMTAARADEVAREIMRSGEVARSRANLIARTEVGRAATNLTHARALHVGSPGYVWQTSRDGRVRPSHKKMQGVFVAWGSPPTLDNLTGHAGALPNCRCYPQVVLPDLDPARTF